MSGQLEQLLTCCICLDRYRNPKLLPCQHSVCVEPCMEGLVDYVKRQVKCPECRAEHRVPYNGIQGFPANVTLQRFLDAQIEITGEAPDPHTGQYMERCNVCTEKDYLSVCAHCEKKICDGCKAAHSDVLKREIGRINNQVRRASHRLSEQLENVERSITSTKTSTQGITEEIENISKRLQKAIRDRENYLKSEVQTQSATELKSMQVIHDGLVQEVENINSNVELVETHMDDGTPWTDAELMDTKDIFLKTMEFIRTFDYDNGGEYSRRTRFMPPDDLNKLASSLSNMGELNIPGKTPAAAHDPYASAAPSFSPGGLSRSKSDHRLAVQFREQEDAQRRSPFNYRKFGERPPPPPESNDTYETEPTRRKFRSRFIKNEEDEKEEEAKNMRPRCIDTEDVSRGPLSGIVRISDSPRAIQRIQEKDTVKKKEKQPPPPVVTPVVTMNVTNTYSAPRAARQVSEDEIDKIKKQNKTDDSTTVTTSTTSTTSSYPSAVSNNTSSSVSRSSTLPEPTATSNTNGSSYDDDTSNRTRNYNSARTADYYGTPTTTNSSTTRSVSRKNSIDASAANTLDKRPSRDNSTENNLSHEEPKSSGRKPPGMSHVQSTLSRFSSLTEEDSASTTPKTRPARYTNGGANSRYQSSRFAGRASTPSAENSKESVNDEEEEEDDDEESSDETESDDSEESSDEEEEEEKPVTLSYAGSNQNNSYTSKNKNENDSAYGSRYGTSSNDSTSSASHGRRPSFQDKNDESDKYSYSGSKYLSRNKTETPEEETKSPFQSRFLNRSKSSAVLGPDASSSQRDDDSSTKGSGRARFDEMKERRQRIARSKSSAGLDDDDTVVSESSTPAYRSRYSRDDDTNSTTPSRTAASNTSSSQENGSNAQLSTWARYLKNKYGNKNETSPPKSTGRTGANNSGASAISTSSGTSTTSTSRALARSRSSHLLGLAKDSDSTTTSDSSKNVDATPTFPAHSAAADMLVVPTRHIGDIHRNQYLKKQSLVLQIGGRGSDPGSFTWPRGIAVGPDNIIVVADSSNHRVQVFDQHGQFSKEFGSYGSHYAEFDCLAGVAINRIGQFIIADRYNHRIQIFDPSGMFIRSFGSQGSTDCKFSYPWGVATDPLGFIYVCDKENHRIQVFQSDGTFVGKFGSMGSGPGQLQHPHYVAVSSTNKVVVSDSNNHRIQMFDVNGNHITSFGGEGAEEGKFKFPRGVAVDEHGYIVVADSGNNRIQVFTAEGVFVKAFGRWGSDACQFKGLEGVAVTPDGNILVCDRENHRVQAF